MARSKWEPRFGMSEGDSSTVTRRVAGQVKPAFATAERHRSRPSDTDASGRPTSAVATMPWVTSTWTSMRCPMAPVSAMLRAVATGISPLR